MLSPYGMSSASTLPWQVLGDMRNVQNSAPIQGAYSSQSFVSQTIQKGSQKPQTIRMQEENAGVWPGTTNAGSPSFLQATRREVQQNDVSQRETGYVRQIGNQKDQTTVKQPDPALDNATHQTIQNIMSGMNVNNAGFSNPTRGFSYNA